MYSNEQYSILHGNMVPFTSAESSVMAKVVDTWSLHGQIRRNEYACITIMVWVLSGMDTIAIGSK